MPISLMKYEKRTKISREDLEMDLSSAKEQIKDIKDKYAESSQKMSRRDKKKLENLESKSQ